MARNRMIRPEFWEDSKINKLSPYARLLFIAMWNFADDEGYLIHDLEWLKTKCLPYDKVNIEKLLEEIILLGRIESKNGIIHIKNFLKYQKIQHPSESELKGQFTNAHEDSGGLQQTVLQDKIREVKISEEKLREVNSFVDFEKSTLKSWNSFCDKFPSLPKVREISGKRRGKLKKRFEKESFRQFNKILEAIEAQEFLRGVNDTKWSADFDWIIENDTNYLKILEMKYLKREPQKTDWVKLMKEKEVQKNAG